MYEVIGEPPSEVGGVNETKALVSETFEIVGGIGRDGLNSVDCNVKLPPRQPCAQYCQAVD